MAGYGYRIGSALLAIGLLSTPPAQAQPQPSSATAPTIHLGVSDPSPEFSRMIQDVIIRKIGQIGAGCAALRQTFRIRLMHRKSGARSMARSRCTCLELCNETLRPGRRARRPAPRSRIGIVRMVMV